MKCYAVAYNTRHEFVCDIGKFDDFSEAVAAAVEYGAAKPITELVDAAEMILQVRNSQIDTISIKRFDDDREGSLRSLFKPSARDIRGSAYAGKIMDAGAAESDRPRSVMTGG
jgi:hypothetical protein